MKKLFTLAFAAIFISSCVKQTEKCVNEGIAFRLIGFTAQEADTVIIRQYFKNTRIQAKDSLVNTTTFRVSDDTLSISQGIIADSFDVTLGLPSVNRVISITDITSEPPHTETYRNSIFAICTKRGNCYNQLLSYKIDGKRIDMNSNGGSGYKTIDIIK